jgi:hypothetical protein
MISIKYFVKPSRNTLMARIRSNGQQLTDISTGIKLGTSNFDYDAGRFPSSEHVANKKLLDFETLMHERTASVLTTYGDNPPADVLIQSLKNKDHKPRQIHAGNITLSWMVAEYKRRHEEGLVFNAKSGKKLAKATIDTMVVTTCGLFQKYIDAGNDMDFTKYNLATIPAVGKNIVHGQYEQMINSYKAFLIDRKLSEYTVFKMVYKLKQMIVYFCEKESIEISSLLKGLKYSKPNREVEVINPEQIRWIINNYAKMQEDCTTPRQREAVDYLLIGILLNARRGDMNNWKAANLYEKDGQIWLKFKPQKTMNSSGVVVDIPVPELAMLIFQKNITRHGKLLPTLSASLNKRLKEIASRYDMFKNEVQIYRKGEYIKVPAWKSIHIHQMRSSGASDKLLTMPEAMVRDWGGWTHDSDAFKRYVNVAKEAKKDFADTYFKGLT